MTEQEIKDGSILIAKFLGWVQGFIGEWTCPFEPSKNGFRNIYAPNGTGMKFHTDWNWLIAGAKKFDEIHSRITEEHMADYVCKCDEQDDAVTCYDIEKAFEVLVNNIKWYNFYHNMTPGDKVHYIAPHEGAVPQNGVFKSLNEYDDSHIFVVFNCGEDWERYKDYTGQNTPISRIFPGWV